MTYRIGAHSTSDDDSKYRNPHAPEPGWDSERAYWEARSPINRFGKFLINKGWWDLEHEAELRKVSRKRAITALNDAEKVGNPHIKHLFTDVFDDEPWHLKEQMAELKDHLERYREHYKDIPGEEIDTLGKDSGEAAKSLSTGVREIQKVAKDLAKSISATEDMVDNANEKVMSVTGLPG